MDYVNSCSLLIWCITVVMQIAGHAFIMNSATVDTILYMGSIGTIITWGFKSMNSEFWLMARRVILFFPLGVLWVVFSSFSSCC